MAIENRINVNRLLTRATQLARCVSDMAAPRYIANRGGDAATLIEASGQVSYILYVLDDIRNEGVTRSPESSAMLVDIEKFCDEIESRFKLELKTHHEYIT